MSDTPPHAPAGAPAAAPSPPAATSLPAKRRRTLDAESEEDSPSKKLAPASNPSPTLPSASAARPYRVDDNEDGDDTDSCATDRSDDDRSGADLHRRATPRLFGPMPRPAQPPKKFRLTKSDIKVLFQSSRRMRDHDDADSDDAYRRVTGPSHVDTAAAAERQKFDADMKELGRILGQGMQDNQSIIQAGAGSGGEQGSGGGGGGESREGGSVGGSGGSSQG